MHSQRLSRSYQATGCWYGYRCTVTSLLAMVPPRSPGGLWIGADA